MQKRGYKHNTPLPKSNQPYICTKEEYKRDHDELAKRQQEPAKR
jgi:hypothetical protein